MNASFPLATLKLANQVLTLRVAFLGTYSFSMADVSALETVGRIPVFHRGVRIVHTRPDYPNRVIFWCFGNPEHLIQQIQMLGFVPRGQRSAVQAARGMPLRWGFVIGFVIVWNALFIMGGAFDMDQQEEIPTLIVLAFGLTALIAIAAPFSSKLQAVMLKPGRHLTEIRSELRLIGFITTVLFLAFGAASFFTAT
jgi:hypothetical protein